MEKKWHMILGLALIAVLGWAACDMAQGQVRIEVKGGAIMAQPLPANVPPSPSPKKGQSASMYSAIKLVEKSEYRQFINVARDCIKDKAWNDAVTALQSILDNKEDFYVQVKERDAHGREVSRRTSVKFEANNLLGSIPKEGLEVYEVRFGGKARHLLDEARRKGDWEQLADVAQRFLHTKAGAEANELLAKYFLDRGQFFTAALRFDRILHAGSTRKNVSDMVIYLATLAFRRSGETQKADATWKLLEERLRERGGLKVGDHIVGLARLQQVLNQVPRPVAQGAHDWPLIRGNASNSAQAVGSPPLLDVILWQRPAVLDKDELSETGVEDKGKEAKRAVEQAVQHQKALGQPVMSGFFPIAVGNLLIYRTYRDVRAVLLREEKDAQGNVIGQPGDIAWKSTEFDGSLAVILDDATKRSIIENSWLPNIKSPPMSCLNLVYENTLVGTLSTDHRLVYAVDDLSVPSPMPLFNPFNGFPNQGQADNKIRGWVMGNSLQAFDIHTGKNTWRLGGPATDNYPGDEAFNDSHFLGVPLSVGGKLYVLNEKNNGPTGDSELRLVCIDPFKKTGHKPQIVSIQTLGMVQQQHRISNDISRRINAVHLAYGEGILVCPTNAGEVLGVDLLSKSLAWAYPYREASPSAGNNVGFPGGGFAGGGFPGGPMPRVPVALKWKSSPPVIQDGKVVFTAPDADSLHCINLRDGTQAWKSPRLEDDLFLAGVFHGKVLIVGKNSCRLLNLSNGAQVGYLVLNGVPTGQGVACRDVYYLPLVKDDHGEILAIDVNRGTMKARNQAASKEGVPGNLLFHEGVVVSQTPEKIIAHPQLAARLELVDRSVQADPNNLEKLFQRGQLRLYDGQVANAVEDLRSVLAKNPPAKLKSQVRQQLFEAYSDLFQADFNTVGERYLKEYRELCLVRDNPLEQQHRQSRYLRIVAQGLENKGNLVQAFQMYREFGALPLSQKEGVAPTDDPSHKVPASVWLRGRISAMIAKADPKQSGPLEAMIADEWKRVQSKKDIDSVRSFVSMFDVPFKVGREARLRFAETVIDRMERNAFLEAELNLEQVRTREFRNDPSEGGRALADLALLEEKKGTVESMKLAAAYYRKLGADFAKSPVRGKKTGADLLNELATDKRFLPYLEEHNSFWGNAPIKARELQAEGIAGTQEFRFQPEGDVDLMLQNLRLAFDPSNASNPQLRLVDVTSNQTRWTIHLGSWPSNYKYYQYLYQQNQNMSVNPARLRFHLRGHLAVAQLGTQVCGIDLDSSRVLWQCPLLPDMQNVGNVQQIYSDREGNLEMLVVNQMTGQFVRERVGRVAAVQASYVALLTQRGLIVLDPLHGNQLWTKKDVPPRAQVFGDESHIYLVLGGDGNGTGQVLRASDGARVDVPDFAPIFQNRLRVTDGLILAGVPGKDSFTLKQYDILLGKERWSRTFEVDAVAVKTEDPQLAGVINSKGVLAVLDVTTGRDILKTNVLQGRVKPDDLKNLYEPLLLSDRDHFYLALNHAVDGTQAFNGWIGSNFTNGLRCRVINGWFMAFYARDVQERSGLRKKGELHWHSFKPLTNQMIVLDQFKDLPILIFTARYQKGNNRWVAVTQTIHKKRGSLVWDSGEMVTNQAPLYYAFRVDPKLGTIELISYGGVLQHYIADGRALPPGTLKQSGSVSTHRQSYQGAFRGNAVQMLGQGPGQWQAGIIVGGGPVQLVVPLRPPQPLPAKR
jgi:tetratricopeptide (TPR) repeat protein